MNFYKLSVENKSAFSKANAQDEFKYKCQYI